MPYINLDVLRIITLYNYLLGSDNLYYKKVEITGINTALLPTLAEEERQSLIKRMKQGDKKAKDTLVMANLKLILSVIQKVNSRNIDPDDLFQVGCIGLIKALNNFNPDLNVRFSTYGVVMISGEIKRYVRDNRDLKVSLSTKDLAYKIMGFKEKYIKENGSEPTVEQIAGHFGVSAYRVGSALEAVAPAVSLYDPAFCDGGDGAVIMDGVCCDSFEDAVYSKVIIQDIIKKLKKREKYILNLRFIQGKTQTQVASIVGISQAQVSRIEKNVISDMKKQLGV